jgi:hypothetical protein
VARARGERRGMAAAGPWRAPAGVARPGPSARSHGLAPASGAAQRRLGPSGHRRGAHSQAQHAAARPSPGERRCAVAAGPRQAPAGRHG